MNFFSELKRRNVYNVAVAYAVVGWLIMQVAATIVPALHLPDVITTAVVVVTLLGFPIALIIAWAFEMTPDGMKRTENMSPDEHIPQWSRRKFAAFIIIVALLAAGLLGFHLWREKTGSAVAVKTLKPLAEGAPPIPEKSIAVLPFENLSEEKANAFFASGIQDEILTRLAKISDLKVVSRTSTQQYQSKPESLTAIAQQLGVAHILEGSVQKAGDAVHINVQLIKAATDTHLWAESYDRELKNIFGVEGEVAGAIADALNAKLTGSEKQAIADQPTQNAAAYEAYLRGLSLEHKEYGYTIYQQVAQDYTEAVRLDPKFALAWARLGVIQSFLYFNAIAQETNSAAAVKEAADHAIALAPEAGESWIALGSYRYRVQRDFTGALEAYKKAQQLLPNNSLVLIYTAYVDRRLGRWKEAETNYNKALQLDPRNVQLLNSLGAEFYFYLRRYDEAIAVLHRALEISPHSESSRANLAAVLQSQGRLVESAQELARIPVDSTDDWVVANRVAQAFYERHFETAIKVIDQKLSTLAPGQSLDSYSTYSLVNLGYAHEWSGHAEEAHRAFTRAIKEIKPTPETVVVPDANGTPQTLALAHAGLGEKQQALEQAHHAVVDYATDAVNLPPAQVVLAQIQARFGDLDSAIAALPHLLAVPAGIAPADLRYNPIWDPLRKDPRFQALYEGKPQ